MMPGTERAALHLLSVVGVGTRCTVSVELRRGDDQALAVAEGVLSASIVRRMVADVTLQALATLEPAATQVAVDAVVVTPMGSQTVITVTLVYVMGQHEEVFAGSAVVRPAGEYDAVARAVLDGTNRRVVSRA